MEARYLIDVDVPNRLVTAQLFGFWSPDDARAFVRDQQAAVRRVSSRPNQHLVLVDLTAFSIQTQEVVAICRDLIARTDVPARRLAIIAGDGLARIQIKRVLVRERTMAVFDERSAAMRWLMAAEDQARHAV